MTNSPIFCCAPGNDLYVAYLAGGGTADRVDDPADAIATAPAKGTVLVLADDYPHRRTTVDFAAAAAKQLRLYAEFPAAVPGVELGTPRSAQWERLVATGIAELEQRAILAAHACVFLPTKAPNSVLWIARVAGYDTAEFGLPDEANSVLFRTGTALVATTKLSGFRTGRYAPAASWTAVWRHLLAELGLEPTLVWTPVVTPSFGPEAKIGAEAEKQSLERVARWHFRADVILTEEGERQARALIPIPTEAADRGAVATDRGDGRYGVLEGYESQVQPDGSQQARIALRADCVAETAMVLAATGHHGEASNLLDYLYRTSGMCGGDRADPRHPAYGHIAWGIGSTPWETANYGDDNARVILASLLAAGTVGSDRWLEQIVRAILANLRTTGRRGFRGDRIDMPDLTANGWRHYRDRDTVNLAPHFESYLWGCYLWAFRVTDHSEYLDCAKAGITAMMAAFPSGWRRNDVTERARMLLPLSWLVRVEDTVEHREWLVAVADDLVRDMPGCGAIPERELGGPGLFQRARSNEEYGITESPLIQRTGDPASDQLYTTGFALIGLHEAARATGDARFGDLADRLAGYLVRIQTRSDNPRLDGTWLRAFDFRRWDYWSSSGDLGWGAWSIELGWGQSWIAAALALRQSDDAMWDRISGVTPDSAMADRLRQEMLYPGDQAG